MSNNSSLPIAPARVRALLLPIGQIKKDRFLSFVRRLRQEHVVHLRDISADPRPNRNMFSPLAFPDGAIFYDLVTHNPPPSHLALSPFELYREPLVVIAIADGKELENVAFSKRQSGGPAPTMTERNIRTLYQDLENMRDAHAKALAHQVLIFDYVPPSDQEIPIPEGIKTVPPIEQCKRTTMKTIMCDISSLMLAEMNTLAKTFEAMTVIDSPGHPSRPGPNGSAWTSDELANPPGRRNSGFALPTVTRSVSASSAVERHHARMSMPAFRGLSFGSSSSSPTGRPTTPVHRSGLSQPPTTFEEMGDDGESPDPSSPEPSRPPTSEGYKSPPLPPQDKVTVQGFGSGGPTDRYRTRAKGRSKVLVGSLYLQAGRWSDALKELIEGGIVAKSVNDHPWHGKALELITICLLLYGWAGLETKVPMICLPPSEKPLSNAARIVDSNGDGSGQPKWLIHFQSVLPELLDRILGLYTRISGENLPPLPYAEAVIRFSNILTALHLYEGKLDKPAIETMLLGRLPAKPLTTSPRLSITPTRAQIVSLLYKAFPSSSTELLTTVDRAMILSGIATALGVLGFQRKKAMVVRELVSVLISGLVEARTRGAAEVGIHPAAGLVALDGLNGQSNKAGALDLGESDIEYGIEAFLGLLCGTYGVVGFNGVAKPGTKSTPSHKDTDSNVISRIQNQSSARHFGMQGVKLNVLRACINFSEALPDFNGVLKFSSDLLRTAGSGIAPGPRREDAGPIITREEQIRLMNNISKTTNLSRRLGLGNAYAEYWDEFLVRGITMDPLPPARAPLSHAKSVLPGAHPTRTSQDVDPFIYNPFLAATEKAGVERILVVDEAATFRITLQNPYDIDVEIESIKLDTEGAAFEASVARTVLGPYRTQILKVQGTPKAAGFLQITGAIVQVRGCRERRFPIFPQTWAPELEVKIKGIGLAAIKKPKTRPYSGPPLSPADFGLSVIPAQPLLAIKSTTLHQSAVMILEGEKQVFSITLQNLSTDTPADLLLFSFKDSTQGPLQTAIANRDATPAELYEYELVLAKKPALRLRKGDGFQRFIAPGGTRTYDFEILGKPGLTNGTIQIDYAYLGVPQEEIKEHFHTRQVCVDLTVTVNASVELARMDLLPLQGEVPRPLWNRIEADADTTTSDADKYCLLLMDLRNAWPSHMQIRLEVDKDFTIEEDILPGNTNRILLPIPRVFLEDPYASIPQLNTARQRQFVVSTSKITPETERSNREAFWLREKILDSLKATWKTLSGRTRQGSIELRGIRLTPRMIEAVKIDEVGIDISVESCVDERVDTDENASSSSASRSNSETKAQTVYVDEFIRIKVHLTNRNNKPIYPTVRLMPALSRRPLNVALDFTRKIAWNGTLQQTLPLLDAHASTDWVVGATMLCRGDFEVMASVEETQLWTEPEKEKDRQRKRASTTGGIGLGGGGRYRSDTQTTQSMAMDAVLGPRERRIWHSRHRCLVSVQDREDDV